MIKIAEQYLGIGRSGKLDLMQYYNANCFQLVEAGRRYKIQPHDEWCAMFTSVMAHKAGIDNTKFPYEVSVFYQARWAKDRGLFYTDINKIKPNDLIIYDWQNNGTLDHVGIVVSHENGVITVIEGNKGDTVAYRKISDRNQLIEGFINIQYPSKTVLKSPTLDENERIEKLVAQTLIGMYGNGVEREKALGNDAYEVQARINRRLK